MADEGRNLLWSPGIRLFLCEVPYASICSKISHQCVCFGTLQVISNTTHSRPWQHTLHNRVKHLGGNCTQNSYSEGNNFYCANWNKAQWVFSIKGNQTIWCIKHYHFFSHHTWVIIAITAGGYQSAMAQEEMSSECLLGYHRKDCVHIFSVLFSLHHHWPTKKFWQKNYHMHKWMQNWSPELHLTTLCLLHFFRPRLQLLICKNQADDPKNTKAEMQFFFFPFKFAFSFFQSSPPDWC